MKKITTEDGNEIYTPWLTTKEAMQYCGYAAATFYKYQKLLPIPHSGTTRSKRYHVAIVDVWLEEISKMDGETPA